jgi:hypothetical protein
VSKSSQICFTYRRTRNDIYTNISNLDYKCRKAIVSFRLISNHFPEKRDVFHITDEQFDENSGLYNKMESNLCIPSYQGRELDVNITRTIGLPHNYTVREEFIRCGKCPPGKCKSCSHRPHYYSYWRENQQDERKPKVRKNFLGTFDPRL